MAFYHFLAIFPALLIFLSLVAHLPAIAPQMKNAAANLAQEFLPAQASTLLQQMLSELDRHMPIDFRFLFVCVGAAWAALNGTWALIYGLNTAYEVEERRNWWKLALTIAGLTICLALVGVIALLFLFFTWSFHAAPAALRALEWLTVVLLLMFSFAVVYRFAPNLRDHEWSWSTPGAVCALLLWIGATVGLRLYFQHVNDYTRTYGHLNSVVMLLLWLYLTNGAILIGGEMNSEIEKAADRQGNTGRTGS